MKHLAVAATLVLMVSATAAHAQQNTSDTATTNSAVTVEAITGPVSEAPAHETVTYSGHEWTTPSVQGSYFAGANPCLIGTGGGIAGGPIGINLNFGRSDEGCTRRSDAAAWHAMGFDNVAVARMCQDRKSADAFFAATGTTCPGADPGRYRTPEGRQAPMAMLVANSRTIPGNPNAGPVDLSNPAVQAAIHEEAARLARTNSFAPQAPKGVVTPPPPPLPQQ